MRNGELKNESQKGKNSEAKDIFEEASMEENEEVVEEVIEDQEIETILEDGEEIDEGSIVSLEGFVEELQEQNKKFNDENIKLSNEVDALKERILRLNAEYENFRKRTSKEKEAIYTSSCEDIMKNMLPVLDNLERALSVGGSVEDLKVGIEMTVRQFMEALAKVQVEEIPTDGEFDPNLHNAVMHEEDEQLGQNQISEVFQKGYKRGDKVLRHSIVKVVN